MAREKVRIGIPFTGGVDEKTDERSLVPGQWGVALNVQATKLGAMQSRAGYASKSKTVKGGLTVGGPALALVPFRDSLVSVDTNGFVSAYKSGTPEWTRVSRMAEASIVRETVHDSAFSETGADSASNGTFVVRTWMTNTTSVATLYLNGDVFAAQYEVATGTPTGPPVRIFQNATAAKIAIVGSTIVIVAWNAALNVFQYVTASPGDSAWTVAATLTVTTPDTADSYVFDWIALSDRFVLAYPPTAGNGINLRTYSTALAVTNSQTLVDANCDAPMVIALTKDGSDNVYMVYYAVDSGGVIIVGMTSKFTNALGLTYGPVFLPAATRPAVISTHLSVLFMSGGALMVAMTGIANPAVNGTYCQLLNPATGLAIGNTVFTPVQYLASKLFVTSTDAYAFFQVSVTTDSGTPTLQGTIFLLCVGSTAGAAQVRPTGTIAPRLAVPGVPLTQRPQNSLSSIVTSGNTYTTILSVVTDGQYPAGRSSTIRVAATFRDVESFTTATCGEDLIIGGGVPWLYDGADAFEQGFLMFPEGITGTISGVGGNIGAGTYLYCVVYEYIDATGQRHQSAPSPATSSTYVGATSSATFIVPNLQITNKNNSNLSIVLYRTLANGTTFHRVYGDVASSGNANVLNVATTTIGDTFADAAIASNPVLYTTGGELPNFCPPSATIVCEHKNRTWLAGTDEGRGVWFSKQMTFGIAPGFNDVLQLYFPQGGRVTGLASIDDKLIVFKEDRIYVVQGDGPPNTGAGAGFDIQNIASDDGCTNPRSVVVTPMGVMFLGRKGIMLLSRDMQVSYIGANIETSMVGQTIYSAVLVPRKNQVRFSAVGVTFVFDYLVHQWYVWSIYDENAAAIATSQAACLYSNTYYYMGSGATSMLYAEDDTFNYDGSTSHMITMQMQTGWIKTSTMLGFQRVSLALLLAESIAASTITVQISTDYATVPTSTFTFTPIDSGPHFYQGLPTVQKCAAMRVTLTTTTGIGAGAAKFVGFDLDIWRDTRSFRGVAQGQKA